MWAAGDVVLHCNRFARNIKRIKQTERWGNMWDNKSETGKSSWTGCEILNKAKWSSRLNNLKYRRIELD